MSERGRLRIAFSGAHGTGKTTIGKEISGRFNLPLIDGVATKVFRIAEKEAPIETIKDSSLYEKMVFQSSIMFTYAFAEERLANFLTTRSMFDHYAYLRYFVHPELLTGNVLAEHLSKLALRAALQYDLIFYFPLIPDKDFNRKSNDKFDRGSAKELDGHIRLLFREFEIPYRLVSGSEQERLALVDDSIRRFLSKKGKERKK